MRLFGGASPVVPRTKRARALTASSREIKDDNNRELKRTQQDWQRLALQFYHSCGECWYPAQGYARSLQKIRIFPAILDERGDPQEVDSGPLVDLLERVQDPGGGRTELLGNYGRLMFLTGDGRLTVTIDEEEDEGWEFLSPVELTANENDGGWLRKRAPGLEPEALKNAPLDSIGPGEARVWRLWRRDPEYSSLADAPVRGVLDLYEVLQNLTLAVGAKGKSRAANRGGFFMPNDLEFGSPGDDGLDEDPESNDFFNTWIEAQITAIKNPGSAAAMSPISLNGPAVIQTQNGAIPTKDCMGWIPMGPPDGYDEIDAWERTIARIANGVDLPIAMVTGDPGSANHWGAWLVDEQGFRLHIAPVAQRFCDDLTSAYLRRAAIEAGIANAERVVVAYDPAEAVNHPDETKTARDAYLDLVVGSNFYRDKINATDADKPTEEDIALVLALKGKVAVDPELDQDGETQPQDGGRGEDVDEEAPAQNGNGTSATAASSLQAARILGAAEMQVERARSLAGARLTSKSKSCEDCRHRIEHVPLSLVASALGADHVRELVNGSSEASLVAGAGDELATTLRRWGVAGLAAIQMGNLIEGHALRTLYEDDPPPLPSGFQAVVAKALR